MKEISLKAVERKGKSTNKELSTLRANSQIPGIVYGGSRPSLRVALSAKELLTVRKQAGVNAVMQLKVGKATETVIVKAIQWDPVTDRPIHADFQRISMTQKIEAKVPIEISGEAPGVEVGGGVLEHEFRFLAVKALPTKIPQRIVVDVSALELGKHILVRELRLPSDIEVLTNPEQIVVHVTIPRVVEEEPVPGVVAAEGAVEGALEGAAAAAEPESSSTKGKKDEEGKLVAKTAAEEPAKKGK